MEIVLKYFAGLTELQKERFDALDALYSDWNSKINVISRKDMENFAEHHVLHSLAIAKFIRFASNSEIIDVGTGGGFPGIPLAIMFPEARFTLIDSIGKKINVVNAVAESLGLDNVQAHQIRSESLKRKYDFVVSRAVASLPEFVKQTRHLISSKPRNAISNGILYLKGGDLTHEILPFKKMSSMVELKSFFKEEYFSTKKLVHLSL
ncbi:MAG: 16S rRNA (guanine(527)-N(7))-methyltransferase RsmG [Cytophagaceae bacterium]|jgi:16S rRNA (guanine527-N7)-methyltransferase|nr:16S rRNA (guanine(527)-N(7))-methyltransferase RsmG [Cytophagaceae bacterium]